MQHDYLILHGINLNMFGRRDPAVYGTATLEDINKLLYSYAGQMGVKIECYQTNSEAGFVERIHHSLDDGTRGIVVNAGAWTHYSYGILDALGMRRDGTMKMEETFSGHTVHFMQPLAS